MKREKAARVLVVVYLFPLSGNWWVPGGGRRRGGSEGAEGNRLNGCCSFPADCRWHGRRTSDKYNGTPIGLFSSLSTTGVLFQLWAWLTGKLPRPENCVRLRFWICCCGFRFRPLQIGFGDRSLHDHIDEILMLHSDIRFFHISPFPPRSRWIFTFYFLALNFNSYPKAIK